MVLCNLFYWVYLVLSDAFVWKLEKHILSLWPTGNWIFRQVLCTAKGLHYLIFYSFSYLGRSWEKLFFVPGALQSVMFGGKKKNLKVICSITVGMYKKEGGLQRAAALSVLPSFGLVRLGWVVPFTAPRGRLNISLVEGRFVIVAHSSGCVFYSGYALPILYLSACFLKGKVCKRFIKLGYPFYLYPFCHYLLSACVRNIATQHKSTAL